MRTGLWTQLSLMVYLQASLVVSACRLLTREETACLAKIQLAQ